METFRERWGCWLTNVPLACKVCLRYGGEGRGGEERRGEG